MRILYFLLGLGLAIVCLVGRWSFPGVGYPFSGHMLRHTVLLLVAGPLLALAVGAGGSPGARAAGPSNGGIGRFSAWMSKYPLVAWLTGIGLMWVWHLPALYNAMPMAGMDGASGTMPSGISLLHGLSLLAGGAIFCWPVVMPFPALRLMPLKAVLYLSSACVFCSLLGLLITFAPLDTFRGVSSTDLQAAGLIMWVPCCFIYLSASMYLLVKWFSLKEERTSFQPLNNW